MYQKQFCIRISTMLIAVGSVLAALSPTANAVPAYYDVTPSVNGNGTINPSEVQSIQKNQTGSFTLDPGNQNYFVNITGTCTIGDIPATDNGNGTWAYTTGGIKEACTVIGNFDTGNNLTVTTTGGGTVTSSPSGIDCGADCTENYAPDSVVNLTATAAADSTFEGWSGNEDCTDGSVTMDANKSCTATFAVEDFTITASASPPAGGEVNCIPNPVDTGSSSTCTISVSSGYTLDIVTGTCGGTLSENTYTTDPVTSDCTVIGNFVPEYNLTVTTTGGGTVTSSPSGIDCGADCTENYAPDSVVNLTATAAADSTFEGWSGNEDCTDGSVTMDANKSCTATFAVEDFTITASASPPAGGEVNCIPNPVDTGSSSTCTISVSSGYTLDIVTGTCGGTLSENTYTTDPVTSDCTVIGNFVPEYNLTVTTTGGGTVTSSPSGIDCGADCTENYAPDSVVNLTATAAADSTFEGWSGNEDCTDGSVTMDANKSCTATFAVEDFTITASASPPAGGEVNCIPNPVDTGSSSTCTISVSSGYTLDIVTGTCGGTLSENTYTTDPVTSDCTVIVNFSSGFSWPMFLPATTNKSKP